MGVLLGGKITIYYTECFDKDNTSLFKVEAEQAIPTIFTKESEDIRFKAISSREMEKKRNFFDKFLKLFKTPFEAVASALFTLTFISSSDIF